MADTSTVDESKLKGDIRSALTFRAATKSDLSKFDADGSRSSTSKGNFSYENDIQAGSRSYKLSDFNWSEIFDLNMVYDSSRQNMVVPKIILTEFQPDRSFKWEAILKPITNSITKAGELIGSIPLVGGLVTAPPAAVGEAVSWYLENQLMREYATGLSFKDGQVQHPALGNPVEMVKRLLSGRYLGSYELPYLGDDYIKADTTNGWSMGGSGNIIGSELEQVLQNEYNINFPTAPVWKKGSSSDEPSFEFTLYLINDNNDHLKKNFKFLHSFVSGAFWIQMDFIQRSPNLYDVEIPGRQHLYFCSMGVHTKYMGRLRTNPEVTSFLKRVHSVYGLPDENEMLYPDAYQMTIKINSLVPNNFNMYANYFYDRTNRDQVYVGNQIERFGLGDYFGMVIDRLKATKDDALSAAKGETEGISRPTGRKE
ncbi:MAG TPA: hypothetical protein PLA71_00615 [Saccharofermentans sp.]|nr:hypothetical protein [Saccharofermentans sp.]